MMIRFERIHMRTYCKSVEGSSHIDSGLPCQDFSLSESDSLGTIVAISDGHGSETYVRSHIGSRLACEIAVQETKRFVSENYQELIAKGKKSITYSPNDSAEQEALFANLFSSIHDKWFSAIKEDAQSNPFSSEEQLKLKNAPIKQAYGCTLIVAMKTRDFTFAYHIGDGRLFEISYDNVWRQCVPWDSDCEDNITTSLCQPDPVRRFRYYLNSSPVQPYIIFMCSDGIEDCYSGSHDGDFESEKLKIDYSEVIRCYLQDNDFDSDCPKFLSAQSKAISHDDMSIAFIIDDVLNLQEKWLKLIALRRKIYNHSAEQETFVQGIKEYDKRIKLVKQYVDNDRVRAESLKSSIDKLEKEVKSCQEKIELAKSSGRSGVEFKDRISQFQIEIEAYCTEFKGNGSSPFKNKLIDYVLKVMNEILEHIGSGVRSVKENLEKLNTQLGGLQRELTEKEGQLQKINDDILKQSEKLCLLEKQRDEQKQLKNKAFSEHEEELGTWKATYNQLRDEILKQMPVLTEDPADAATATVIPAEEQKSEWIPTLNVCRRTSQGEDQDITIEFYDNKYTCTFDGGSSFEITEDEFNKLLKFIRKADDVTVNDEEMLECLIVMNVNPASENSTKYIPLSTNEASDIWNCCLNLVIRHLK